MKKIIIAAVAKNNVIGRTTGEMPWHNKEEFQHFKNTTLGYPVIMGRKTFDSLGKPLKGRFNIILSRNKTLKYEFEDVKVCNDMTEAYTFCESREFEKVFVIGGGYIFPEAMQGADEMIITVMDMDATGDIFFPLIDAKKWVIKKTDRRSEFEIFYYSRRD